MPGVTTIPPFPDDVPTCSLLIIDYERIKADDKQETDKLWKAATEFGFWYLKNHGLDEKVNRMFEMGARTMKLPLEEKKKFDHSANGQSFGYKSAGTNASNAHGSQETVEFISIPADDTLAIEDVTSRIDSRYPSTVATQMANTIRPFVEENRSICETILGVFERKLAIPTGTLLSAHASDEPSASEARVIRQPPAHPATATPADFIQPQWKEADSKVAHGAHTDFGSLTVLHNRLGGLQVLPPGCDAWQYVRPLSGCTIVNVGDALALLSGGILRSNVHRVVPPPGAQRTYVRWCLVYFLRPADDTRLRALADESELVRARFEAMNEEDKQRYDPKETAREWFARRLRKQKLKN